MNMFVLLSPILLLLGIGILIFSLAQSSRKRRLGKFHVNITPDEGMNWHKLTDFIDKLFSHDHKEIERKLLAAGFYDTRFAKYFTLVKYSLLTLGITGSLVGYLWFNLAQNQFVIFVSVWIVAILMGPDIYIAGRAKALQRSISNKLPYMLDLLAVCVQTGMTIEAAISYLALEFGAFDKDLSYLLKQVDERARLVGLEQALSELYIRVPTNEIRSFVMTINQSLQYGSSIYSVLTTLSADIREVQLLHVEEKIGQLSAKMSIPLIIFIMVPIVILIAAPGIMRMMQNAHF